MLKIKNKLFFFSGVILFIFLSASSAYAETWCGTQTCTGSTDVDYYCTSSIPGGNDCDEPHTCRADSCDIRNDCRVEQATFCHGKVTCGGLPDECINPECNQTTGQCYAVCSCPVTCTGCTYQQDCQVSPGVWGRQTCNGNMVGGVCQYDASCNPTCGACIVQPPPPPPATPTPGQTTCGSGSGNCGDCHWLADNYPAEWSCNDPGNGCCTATRQTPPSGTPTPDDPTCSYPTLTCSNFTVTSASGVTQGIEINKGIPNEVIINVGDTITLNSNIWVGGSNWVWEKRAGYKIERTDIPTQITSCTEVGPNYGAPTYSSAKPSTETWESFFCSNAGPNVAYKNVGIGSAGGTNEIPYTKGCFTGPRGGTVCGQCQADGNVDWCNSNIACPDLGPGQTVNLCMPGEDPAVTGCCDGNWRCKLQNRPFESHTVASCQGTVDGVTQPYVRHAGDGRTSYTFTQAGDYMISNTAQHACNHINNDRYPCVIKVRVGATAGGTIQGRQEVIEADGKRRPIYSARPVSLNPADNTNGSPQQFNPYFFLNTPATAHVVSIPNILDINGYTTGHTVCNNAISCHGANTPITLGNVANVTVPASGWTDLYFHYIAHPNAANISGPATINQGETATFSATFSSPVSYTNTMSSPPTGFFAGMGAILETDTTPLDTWAWTPPLTFIPGSTATLVGNTGTRSFTWTPTATGRYYVFGRAWNDGIAECRGYRPAVGPAPRYECAGPRAFMIVDVVNPTYTIDGYIFDDKDKDTKFNIAVDSLIVSPTPPIISAFQTGNPLLSIQQNTPAPGRFKILNARAGNPINISYSLPPAGGYRYVWPNGVHAVTVGAGVNECNIPGSPPNGEARCVAGNIINLGFAISNSQPWIQGVTQDVRMKGIDNKIPQNPDAACLVSGQGVMIRNTNPSNTTPGLVFSRIGDLQSFGAFSGTASEPTDWRATNNYPQLIHLSYDRVISSLHTQGLIETNPISNSSYSCNNAANCRINSSLRDRIIRIPGNVTVTDIDINQPGDYIILIDGTLRIRKNATNSFYNVPEGSTLFFIATGDITIESGIGNAGAPSCSVTGDHTDLDGVFVTNGRFVMEADTTACPASDLQLRIGGLVAAAGGIRNDRDLCANNLSYPSAIFSERLDFIMNTPPALKERNISFREEAP